MRQRDANLLPRPIGNSAQPRGIHLCHVGKSRAKAILVRARERILPRQVHVVVDHHQRALREARVHAARGICENQRLHAQESKRTNGEGHRARVVSFVHMAPARQRDDGLACGGADDQLAFVADHARRGPVRQPAVRHGDGAAN